jgi:hypothetical protein
MNDPHFKRTLKFVQESAATFPYPQPAESSLRPPSPVSLRPKVYHHTLFPNPKVTGTKTAPPPIICTSATSLLLALGRSQRRDFYRVRQKNLTVFKMK